MVSTPLPAWNWISFQAENPEIIYVGTGQYGSLPLTSDARNTA